MAEGWGGDGFDGLCDKRADPLSRLRGEGATGHRERRTPHCLPETRGIFR